MQSHDANKKEVCERIIFGVAKRKPDNIDSEEILSFVEDILRYFDDDDSEEYENNQELIGILDLFRGHAVKVWSGTNFSDRKYHKLNKIDVRLCVKHYYKC